LGGTWLSDEAADSRVLLNHLGLGLQMTEVSLALSLPPVSTPAAQRGRRSLALATIVLEHQALARLPRLTTNTRANRPV